MDYNALEDQARSLIELLGFRISRGPALNRNRLRYGVYIFSIKSALSKQQLDALGVVLGPDDTPGRVRTVRFLGEVRDDVLLSVSHLGSSGRKKKTLEGLTPRQRKKINNDRHRKKVTGKGKTDAS